MSRTVPFVLNGRVAAGFEGVHDVFAQLFAAGAENLGAAICVQIDGRTVADLWAGHIDRECAIAFTERTLTPVFSVSKAVSSLMIARLVDEGMVSYEQPVAELWPPFAAAGKDAVTVAEALSHQAGLPGFPAEAGIDAETWYDWDAITTRLAAMAPLWPPGTACGYHPVTWGFLAGQIARQASGESLGALVKRHLRDAHGLDVWLGVPDSEAARAATPQKAPTPPDLGTVNTPTRLAFLERWSSPRAFKQDLPRWRRADLPGVNGHATAHALATAMQPFARAGMLGQTSFLSAATVEAAMRERFAGPNLVLPYDMAFSAGLIRNTTAPDRKPYGPGARSVGHTGWGGSCVLADPDARLTFAYATLTHSPALVEDARAQALIAAAYDAL